jgi:hypothetical protein
MTRKALVVAALLSVALLLLAAGRAVDPQLIGTVGTNDAFQIMLTDPAGNAVTKLDPGTYTLLVHDNSSLHDFHLLGPGVDVTTDVDGTGDKTFTVTLVEGRYTFFCDPHVATMNGTVTVGNPPPPPPPPSPPAPTRHLLSAGVGPGKALSLSARTAKAGDYRITVRDRSKTRNFHLVGPGVNKKTGKAFVGTAVWNVALVQGSYRYGSDPALTGKLRVS